MPLLAREEIERGIQLSDATERQTFLAAIRTVVENAHFPTTLGIVEHKLKFNVAPRQSCLNLWVKEYQIEHGWSLRSCFDTTSLMKSLSVPDPHGNLVSIPPAEDMAGPPAHSLVRFPA
jgi:hypothetical protein